MFVVVVGIIEVHQQRTFRYSKDTPTTGLETRTIAYKIVLFISHILRIKRRLLYWRSHEKGWVLWFQRVKDRLVLPTFRSEYSLVFKKNWRSTYFLEQTIHSGWLPGPLACVRPILVPRTSWPYTMESPRCQSGTPAACPVGALPPTQGWNAQLGPYSLHLLSGVWLWVLPWARRGPVCGDWSLQNLLW